MSKCPTVADVGKLGNKGQIGYLSDVTDEEGLCRSLSGPWKSSVSPNAPFEAAKGRAGRVISTPGRNRIAD